MSFPVTNMYSPYSCVPWRSGNKLQPKLINFKITLTLPSKIFLQVQGRAVPCLLYTSRDFCRGECYVLSKRISYTFTQ